MDGFELPGKALPSLCKLLNPHYNFSITHEFDWLSEALLASRYWTPTITAEQLALVESIKAEL